MFRKQKKSPKTCWSAVASVLSALSPKKLVIFFLLASAHANQPVIYLRGNRSGFWNSSTCGESAPGCLLEVSPPPLFEFNRICEGNSLENIKDKSIFDQMRDERFIGGTLCHSVLTSTTVNKDGLLSQTDIDFNMPEEGTYAIRHRISAPKIGLEPKVLKCPEPPQKECPTSSVCRVSMWAVSGGGGVKSDTNPHGFKYKFMGDSTVEVIDYSHKCRVMP